MIDEICEECIWNRALLQELYDLLEGFQHTSLPARFFEQYKDLRQRLAALPFIVKSEDQ